MFGFVRRTARHLIVLGFDVWVHLAEWPRILFLRLIDYSSLIRILERSGTTRLALVAPHPTQLLEFSMRHLVRGLVDNGFSVVVMMYDQRSAAWLKEEFPQIHLAERRKQGRDFGAWKEVLVALLKNKTLCGTIEKLVLVNDSIYWNGSTSEVVGLLATSPKPWACLFENFEHHYHAQSFLLLFDNCVVNSKAFHQFWNKYRPYSSRRHSIDSGEVLLSKRIVTAFGKPACVLSSARVVDKVLSVRVERCSDIILSLDANRHVAREFGLALNRFEANSGLAPNANGYFVKPDKAQRLLELHKLAALIAKLMECSNPTHMTGLLISQLFGFPIKRDLCQRGSFQIADVLRLIAGYSSQESAVIAADLRSKELPISIRGLRRLLFDHGRI
ncbi:hypothetical protein [Rhodopseudomonas sp. G2_2311]|uniref:hypothetical protein n=1 Tax=Rhodopseudomonas sp. G2_2311 TaxID=3114287 RepID=UPI0039C745ED